jgi:hypothetical protein
MAARKKPKGAYPKVGGVGGVEFTGRSKAEKFENYITGIRDTSETRKDRFEDPSRLYAAARKLGLSQKSVKAQIDAYSAEKKKYGAMAEKKAFKLDAEDMKRRSAENTKKKPASKKVSNGSDTKPYNVRLIKPSEIIKDKPAAKKAAAKITKKSATTLSRKPKAGPVVKIAKKAGKK